MKKRVLIFVVLVLALCTVFVGCNKDPEDTYKGQITIDINSVQDFLDIKNKLGEDYRDATFELKSDLDFTSIDYVAIGDSYVNSFRGQFNGNSHKISNLNITKGGEFFGLFGYTVNAKIKDLTLENNQIEIAVKEKENFVGGVVAYSAEKLTLENITVKSSIAITMNYTTITGENDIKYEYSDSEYIGGALGYALGEVVLKNINTVVTVDNKHPEESLEDSTLPKVNIENLFVGGVAGFIKSTSEKSSGDNLTSEFEYNLYAQKSNIGGSIGYSDNIAFTDLNAKTTVGIRAVSISRSNVGGLIGTASNTKITNAQTQISGITVTIKDGKGNANIGGLIAYCDKGSIIENVTIAVNINISTSLKSVMLGGAVGVLMDSKLNNVTNVSGLILSNGNTLNYETEKTQETRYIAGLVGKIFGKAELKNAKTELLAYQGAVGIFVIDNIPGTDEKPAEVYTPIVENSTVKFLNANCLAQDSLNGSRRKNAYGTGIDSFATL